MTLIPVLGGPDVELLYRAYAIAELEGVEREFNELLSNAVLRRRYDGPTTVLSILEQVGVDSASLDSRSAETKPLVQRYIALSDGYRISATPTIIVNGTHEINLRAINSADQLLAEIAKLLNS
ncbi:hypothetical protein [Aliagarivorans marinus]|uniref:hypothetical protein n=1 Tax=Aliagarivorans marinus TaxID=561965 RepID=UPI0012F7FED3|nr:hypothetical protein [Aliagarivorans marinus]